MTATGRRTIPGALKQSPDSCAREAAQKHPRTCSDPFSERTAPRDDICPVGIYGDGPAHRRRCNKNTDPLSADISRGGYELDSDAADAADKTAARFQALGIQTTPSSPWPFLCVLPGHRHEAHVHYARDRRCWSYSCEGLTVGVGLGEVQAMLGFGYDRAVSRVTAARFGDLLDYRAGLLSVPDLRPLVGRFSPAARFLHSAAHVLVSLRGGRWDGDEFTFAAEFGEAYTAALGNRLSRDQIKRALATLERAGILRRVGTGAKAGFGRGRPVLWQLGELPADDAVAAREDELCAGAVEAPGDAFPVAVALDPGVVVPEHPAVLGAVASGCRERVLAAGHSAEDEDVAVELKPDSPGLSFAGRHVLNGIAPTRGGSSNGSGR